MWSDSTWPRPRRRSCSVSTNRVELRRGTGVAPGPFPQPALRTGRARSRASGSPRPQPVNWRSLASPSVQLGLRPQYRGLSFFPRRPLCADIHRRPPALAARRLRGRCLPSPCRRLSRPRTTTQTPPRPTPSAGDEPSRAWRGVPGSGERGALPKFTMGRLTGWVASFVPATSPRVRRSLFPWPPHRCLQTASESPERGRASRSGPYPPGWSRRILKGL